MSAAIDFNIVSPIKSVSLVINVCNCLFFSSSLVNSLIFFWLSPTVASTGGFVCIAVICWVIISSLSWRELSASCSDSNLNPFMFLGLSFASNAINSFFRSNSFSDSCSPLTTSYAPRANLSSKPSLVALDCLNLAKGYLNQSQLRNH